MQEVARELQIIRQTQAKIIEAQRQSFQMELERVRGMLELFELKSKLLEYEMKVLKSSG